MHELLPEEPETQEGGESEGEVTRNLYVRFYCLERARQKPVLSPPVRVHCVVFHQNAFHGFLRDLVLLFPPRRRGDVVPVVQGVRNSPPCGAALRSRPRHGPAFVFAQTLHIRKRLALGGGGVVPFRRG